MKKYKIKSVPTKQGAYIRRRIAKNRHRAEVVGIIYLFATIILAALACLPMLSADKAPVGIAKLMQVFTPLTLATVTDMIKLINALLYAAMLLGLFINILRSLSNLGNLFKKKVSRIYGLNANIDAMENMGSLFSGSLASILNFHFLIYILAGGAQIEMRYFVTLGFGLAVHFLCGILSTKTCVFEKDAEIGVREHKRMFSRVVPFIRNLVQTVAALAMMYFFLYSMTIYNYIPALMAENGIVSLMENLFNYIPFFLQLLTAIWIMVLIKHATGISEYDFRGPEADGQHNFRIFSFLTVLTAGATLACRFMFGEAFFSFNDQSVSVEVIQAFDMNSAILAGIAFVAFLFDCIVKLKLPYEDDEIDWSAVSEPQRPLAVPAPGQVRCVKSYMDGRQVEQGGVCRPVPPPPPFQRPVPPAIVNVHTPPTTINVQAPEVKPVPPAIVNVQAPEIKPAPPAIVNVQAPPAAPPAIVNVQAPPAAAPVPPAIVNVNTPPTTINMPIPPTTVGTNAKKNAKMVAPIVNVSTIPSSASEQEAVVVEKTPTVVATTGTSAAPQSVVISVQQAEQPVQQAQNNDEEYGVSSYLEMMRMHLFAQQMQTQQMQMGMMQSQQAQLNFIQQSQYLQAIQEQQRAKANAERQAQQDQGDALKQDSQIEALKQDQLAQFKAMKQQQQMQAMASRFEQQAQLTEAKHEQEINALKQEQQAQINAMQQQARAAAARYAQQAQLSEAKQEQQLNALKQEQELNALKQEQGAQLAAMKQEQLARAAAARRAQQAQMDAAKQEQEKRANEEQQAKQLDSIHRVHREQEKQQAQQIEALNLAQQQKDQQHIEQMEAMRQNQQLNAKRQAENFEAMKAEQQAKVDEQAQEMEEMRSKLQQMQDEQEEARKNALLAGAGGAVAGAIVGAELSDTTEEAPVEEPVEETEEEREPQEWQIACPNCQKRIQVSDENEYHRCPGCGKVLQLDIKKVNVQVDDEPKAQAAETEEAASQE